jgi:imidazole glycerol phosphate synthase subunit HisF
MKKLLSVVAALFLMAGLAVAGEVVMVKYDPDKKELTYKDADKEVTTKISDKVKINVVDKDGNATEGKFEDLEKSLKNPKAAGKMKIEIVVDKEMITEVKYKKKGKN